MATIDNGANKKDLNRETILQIAQEIFSKYAIKKPLSTILQMQ
jgi:hypothetical protein